MTWIVSTWENQMICSCWYIGGYFCNACQTTEVLICSGWDCFFFFLSLSLILYMDTIMFWAVWITHYSTPASWMAHSKSNNLSIWYYLKRPTILFCLFVLRIIQSLMRWEIAVKKDPICFCLWNPASFHVGINRTTVTVGNSELSLPPLYDHVLRVCTWATWV